MALIESQRTGWRGGGRERGGVAGKRWRGNLDPDEIAEGVGLHREPRPLREGEAEFDSKLEAAELLD